MWHLPDGPEQEERDTALRRDDFEEDMQADAVSQSENPNPWSDREFQPWLFGHDVFREANKALDKIDFGK